MNDLHERPADERDENHGQPGRHLGEGPENIGNRDRHAILLERSVERMEDTLIRRGVLKLVVDHEGLDGLGRSGGAVQGNVAGSRGRGRLVGQRLRDGEVVERWRTDGPRVAENGLRVAVHDGELGSVGLSGQEGKGSLVGVSRYSCAS